MRPETVSTMMLGENASQGCVLSSLLSGYVTVVSDQDREITGMAIDSRRVAPGNLYCACVGVSGNGHSYIAQAINAGAAAVIYQKGVPGIDEATICAAVNKAGVPIFAVAGLDSIIGELAERFYGYPSRDLLTIGVTGTNGKTSCTQFLAQSLSNQHISGDVPCGVIGTLGNGLYGSQQSGDKTTPDPVSLHQLLGKFREYGAENVVMEVSSHGLEQGRVNGVSFDVAIFTNLSRDHLDYHGSMQAYGLAKQQLFMSPSLKHAVINADDEFGLQLLDKLPAAIQATAYSMVSPQVSVAGRVVNTVYGKVLGYDKSGMVMHVSSSSGNGKFVTRLVGKFNASNILAVIASLLAIKIPLKEVIDRIKKIEPVPGRMECFEGNARMPMVVVDYAHTPDALRSALQAVRDHALGSVWCVFGCGGDRDVGKRPLMGAVAEQLADYVIVTSDNPRHEDAIAIIEGIVAGIQNKSSLTVIADRAEAINYAFEHAGPDDVILLAGKGHEDYQQIGDEKIYFSDREFVKNLFKENA